MLYEFQCPKCGKTKIVESKLKDRKKLKISCECGAEMKRSLSAHPHHSSWGSWNK
jgi:putative FmdB family regulatory protein